MDKVLKIKQILGFPEISLTKLRSFTRKKQGLLPPCRIPRDVNTIAIVVPCYNHARYLDKMYESIIYQARKPDQVIFVNDASHDDTAEKLNKLIQQNEVSDCQFKLINNANNIGQSASLNKAIEEVETDLIMVLNDDDYLCHDAVELVMDIFNSNKDLYLVGSTAIHFDTAERLEAENEYIRNMLTRKNLELTFRYPSDVLKYRKYNDLNMTHSGSCFLKAAWKIVGGYFQEKRNRVVPFSDRDFQLRVNALFPVAVSSRIPFSFWRSNSSVDNGVDS